MVLPASLTIQPSHLGVDHQPVASGGAGDVYGGVFNGSKVCVKHVRVYARDSSQEVTKVHSSITIPAWC